MGLKDEGFSVASVKQVLKHGNLHCGEDYLMWCKWVPSKCNIFMWRAILDHLPSKRALGRRNIVVEDPMCSFCGAAKEITEHLFTACMLASNVWHALSTWCNIPEIYAFSVYDLSKIHKHARVSRIKAEVVKGLIMIACWKIWKARNEKIFQHRTSNARDIVEVKGYLWFKHRQKRICIEWDN
ncbi:uncharacterized protein LOC110870511 [Helianthus annuus]|uniref:uncharacterized protein LOC110870511 n=1 Tax=Helianthus annuus TaxID=4232 RepID=UPI000B8FE90A|nr:uncharacterized protein LOC110870511 [Helianthus annuus]